MQKYEITETQLEQLGQLGAEHLYTKNMLASMAILGDVKKNPIPLAAKLDETSVTDSNSKA